mgnify:CR=1 FL=1
MMGIIDIADIEIGFDIEDDFYDTYLQTGPRQIRTSIGVPRLMSNLWM